MPFARHSGYSLSPVSVRQNAPAWSGVYGISNADGWICIRETDNIQLALLDHLKRCLAAPEFPRATGFTFEACDPMHRLERCRRLVEEFRPSTRP